MKYFIIFLILIFNSCGVNSSTTNKVEDIEFSPDTAQIQERVAVRVFFDTKRDLDSDPNAIEIVVEVPKTLDLIENSSFLFDNSISNLQSREPNRILDCKNYRYLIYRFDGDELKGTDFDNHYGFKFDVKANVSSRIIEVKAASVGDILYSCELGLDSDVDQLLTIN